MWGWRVALIVLLILGCADNGHLSGSPVSQPTSSLNTSASSPVSNPPQPASPPSSSVGVLQLSQKQINIMANIDVVNFPNYILNGTPPYSYAIMSGDASNDIIEGDQFLTIAAGTTVILITDANKNQSQFTIIASP